MTFYRVWGGKILNSPENIAQYLEEDANYAIEVSKSTGIDTSEIEELKKKCSDAIKNDTTSNLSEREKKFITTIFVGDAEWNEPLEEWMFFPLDKVLEFTDSKVHQKWTDVARIHGELDLVRMPNYSTPSQISREMSHFNDSQHLKGNILLASALLDLEWYNYFVKQMNIEVDKNLIQKTKDESLEYYTGQRKNFSDEVKPFRKSLFSNDVRWIDSMFEDYGTRSETLKLVRNMVQDAANSIED